MCLQSKVKVLADGPTPFDVTCDELDECGSGQQRPIADVRNRLTLATLRPESRSLIEPQTGVPHVDY